MIPLVPPVDIHWSFKHKYAVTSQKWTNLTTDAAVTKRKKQRRRDSVVGIATGYGLDGRGVGVRVHVVQTGSGVHPTSYPMDTGGSFPAGKAAGAWSWPLISN
jgi:hypothetical protein